MVMEMEEMEGEVEEVMRNSHKGGGMISINREHHRSNR